jgi:hypothetical protein
MVDTGVDHNDRLFALGFEDLAAREDPGRKRDLLDNNIRKFMKIDWAPVKRRGNLLRAAGAFIA